MTEEQEKQIQIWAEEECKVYETICVALVGRKVALEEARQLAMRLTQAVVMGDTLARHIDQTLKEKNKQS